MTYIERLCTNISVSYPVKQLQNGRLLDVEPGALHADGHGQELLHLGLGLVDRHVYAVEARVRAREYLDILVAVQAELADVAVVPLKVRLV